MQQAFFVFLIFEQNLHLKLRAGVGDLDRFDTVTT
jgi:hypothetical protein